VGLEAADDLCADLDRAFQQVPAVSRNES